MEALGMAWAITKAAFFLDGVAHFTATTDCEPLLTVFNTKSFAAVENDRLLKLKTKVARFNFTVRWIPGSQNKAADALSRYPVRLADPEEVLITKEEDDEREYVVAVLAGASDKPGADLALEELRGAMEDDEECAQLIQVIEDNWPRAKQELTSRWPDLAPFYRARTALQVKDGIILCGRRAFIPRSLRRETTCHSGRRCPRARALGGRP